MVKNHKEKVGGYSKWAKLKEIVVQFETVLEPLLKENTLSNTSSPKEFQLSPFISAYRAIQNCWSEGIYLAEVFPKFFKLNVQIILRLSSWISTVIRLATNTNKEAFPAHLNKVNILIALHADIEKFITQFPELQQTIYKCLPKDKQLSSVLNESLSKSFKDLQELLQEQQKSIQDALIKQLTIDSGLDNVRQVSDLPRLYRKTNRDVPSRCSGYVEQMLRPLKSFGDQHSNQLGVVVVETVLAEVASKITLDYFNAVTDVLTSVQKTEESLRRLRNLKSANTTMTTSMNSSMSDDDKIRLQLRVDVATWTSELAKFSCLPSKIYKLIDLNNIVEESIKSKDLNSSTN